MVGGLDGTVSKDILLKHDMLNLIVDLESHRGLSIHIPSVE